MGPHAISCYHLPFLSALRSGPTDLMACIDIKAAPQYEGYLPMESGIAVIHRDVWPIPIASGLLWQKLPLYERRSDANHLPLVLSTARIIRTSASTSVPTLLYSPPCLPCHPSTLATASPSIPCYRTVWCHADVSTKSTKRSEQTQILIKNSQKWCFCLFLRDQWWKSMYEYYVQSAINDPVHHLDVFNLQTWPPRLYLQLHFTAKSQINRYLFDCSPKPCFKKFLY